MTCTTDHTAIKTRYCPDCGCATNRSGLHGSRGHIVNQLQMKRKWHAERLQRKAEWEQGHPNESNEAADNGIDTESKAVVKWSSWLTALDELIEGSK